MAAQGLCSFPKLGEAFREYFLIAIDNSGKYFWYVLCLRGDMVRNGGAIKTAHVNSRPINLRHRQPWVSKPRHWPSKDTKEVAKRRPRYLQSRCRQSCAVQVQCQSLFLADPGFVARPQTLDVRAVALKYQSAQHQNQHKPTGIAQDHRPDRGAGGRDQRAQ